MSREFFHPRYWATWLGVGLLRLTILLPWRYQMMLGTGLGKLLYFVLLARRKISCINLEIAFPNKNIEEREELNRQHFISLGQGLFESAIGWWGSNEQIKKLSHVEGIKHLQETIKDHRVIILGAHFASLETGGRIMAQHMPLHVVYRPHQNKLLDYLIDKQRNKQYGKAIPKNNIREMIKSIKSGFPAWYATDQNYRSKGSIVVPFFGVDAPTNPGTSRLAKITKAKVIPCIMVRLNDKNEPRKGYLLRLYPPIENFPSESAYNDTLRLSQIIEEQIQDFPSQYLWTHKRYKHYQGEGDFYKDYSLLNKDSHCK